MGTGLHQKRSPLAPVPSLTCQAAAPRIERALSLGLFEDKADLGMRIKQEIGECCYSEVDGSIQPR